MKKAIKLLFVFAVLSMILAVSAGAADFTACADKLKSLGLFLGTGSGYELDREPTRVESAVMLVRLLGKEESALGGEYRHPFTDVPAWADKYIGYMYENGLTKGVSSTRFGANDLCEGNMYTTFVLRSLGYDDSKNDFSYEDASDFGASVGIVDPAGSGETFLRDDLAAISYISLSVQPKDKSAGTLLDKLVAENAVSAEAAAPILKQFSVYKEYAAACDASNALTKIDMNTDLELSMDINGEKMSASTVTNIKSVYENGKYVMAMTMNSVSGAETMQSSIYYKDGYYYIDIEGAKTKMPMDLESARLAANTAVTCEPLNLIKNIVKTTENGSTVYTIDYGAPGLSSQIDSVLPSVDIPYGTDTQMKFNTLLIKVTVGPNGIIKSQDVTLDFLVDVTAAGQKVSATFHATMGTDLIAWGDSVLITLPDLTTFEETPQPTIM